MPRRFGSPPPRQVEKYVTPELFEGTGRAVGDIRYSNASDWRVTVLADRKRRSYPELMSEFEDIEAGVPPVKEVEGKDVMGRLLERMQDRVESDEWVEGYLRQILDGDEKALKEMEKLGKVRKGGWREGTAIV